MADYSNRDIEFFIFNTECWEVEFGFGIAALNRYCEDIALRQAGFELKDLGISQRREELRPLIITSEGLVDRYTAYDQSITPAGSIALLKLGGMMRAQSTLSTPGMDSMIGDLRAAYSNSNIKGIIIETNSGGGESLAGTMLKSAISERNKPVVGFGHMVASAAYRALSGADEIGLSGEGAEAGSIGTMITADREFIAKYKERYMDFYGATAPEKNASQRDMIAGFFEKVQQRADEKTLQFQEEIKRDRALRGSQSKVTETVNGRMWDASEAKMRGLTDWTGNMNYAIKRVNALRAKY
jgi:protease-4